MTEEVVEKIIEMLRDNINNIRYNYIGSKDRAITSVTYVNKGRRKNIQIFNLHLDINGLSILIEQHEDILTCKLYLNGYRKMYAIRNHLENSIYDICDKLVQKSVRKKPVDVIEDLKVWERNNNLNKLL
jgi:hypothetical protein